MVDGKTDVQAEVRDCYKPHSTMIMALVSNAQTCCRLMDLEGVCFFWGVNVLCRSASWIEMG